MNTNLQQKFVGFHNHSPLLTMGHFKICNDKVFFPPKPFFNASIGTTLWCVRANIRERTLGRRRRQRELCLKVLFPVHCSNFVISISRSEWKVCFNIGMRGVVVWDVNLKCFVRFSRPLQNPLKFGQFTSLSGRTRQKKNV